MVARQKFIDAHKMHLSALLYALTKHRLCHTPTVLTLYLYYILAERYSEYYPLIHNTKYHIEI